MSSQKQANLNTESERIVSNPYKKETESNKISDSPNKDNHQQILVNENINTTDSPEKAQNNPTPIDYSKYTNISQLNPIHIKQLDNNTFLISKTCCEKASYIILACVAPILFLSFSLSYGLTKNKIYLILFIVLIIALIYEIILIIKTVNSIYIILDTNNITVKEEGWCKKRTTLFHSGLLNRAELKCENKVASCGIKADFYTLTFYSNSQNIIPDTCFLNRQKDKNKNIFTDEEMGYFNYVVNNHIQKNMMN